MFKSFLRYQNVNPLLLLLKLLVLVSIFLFLMNHKVLILLLLFEILDFSKCVVKKAIQFIPLDFVFIFGLAAAYYYNPLFSVIIFALSVINRLIMLSIESRHVTKVLRHFLFFFIIPFFRSYNFFQVAFVMLVFNYVLKYGFNIAKADIPGFEKMPFHITNFIGASIFFYLIDITYVYFPFLK